MGKGGEFGGAGLLEASGSGGEFGAEVAGVAHELGGAGGEIFNDAAKIGGGEGTGEDEAGEVIGGEGLVGGEDAGEAGAEGAHGESGEAGGEGDGAGVEGEIKRAADPGDVVVAADGGNGAEDGGEEVGVFVGVEVGGLEAGGEDFFRLEAELGEDVPLAGGEGAEEGGDIGGERAAGLGEAGALDDLEVDADVEGGVGVGELDGVVEAGAGGHEGGGGEDAVEVGFEDAGVDFGGEAEVVGIDEEMARGNQKSASLMRRNFLGLARKSFMRPFISTAVPLRFSYREGFTRSWPRVPWPELILSMVVSMRLMVPES